MKTIVEGFTKERDILWKKLMNKREAVVEIANKAGVDCGKICYIGDSKYDIPAMEKAGMAICPANAIKQVQDVVDIVLERRGGDGCIAEVYSTLKGESYA